MGAIRTWFNSSSLIVKVFMAISITSGAVVLNKFYYAPYAHKKKHLQAEEWANMIIEQEEAMNKSTESQ